MRLNTARRVPNRRTYEGAPAFKMSNNDELRRAVLSCLLWENQFYESGESIADRIVTLVHKVPAKVVADLAVEARTEFRLRHVPLLLVRELARSKDTSLVASTLEKIIQRPDELAEFMAIYWKDGRQPVSAQVKKGLARAFVKFNGYQLAKYDRAGPVRLRDVLFISHAKPRDKKQAAMWKALIDGSLESPDTWEVGLSKGEDKKETFTRLLSEKKLGYMALLRNLRNMQEVGVDERLVKDALIEGAAYSKALPFRYLAAAKAAPRYEPTLDMAMVTSMEKMDRLQGRTAVLVDVSGSMYYSNVSQNSDLTRADAAAALASLVTGTSDDCRVFTFSRNTVEVPARRGMALIDAVHNSQGHGATNLGDAVRHVNNIGGFDRIIVITDEQSRQRVDGPHCKGYMINVSSYNRSVDYGAWTKISGFSEATIKYIQEIEYET